MTGYPKELNDRCFNTLNTFSQFDTLDGIRSLLVGPVLQAFHDQVEFLASKERCVRNFLLKFWNHKLNETDWFMVLFLKELYSTTLDYDVKRELEKLPIEIKAFLDGNPGKIAQSPNISFYQVQEGAKQDQAYVQKVDNYNTPDDDVKFKEWLAPCFTSNDEASFRFALVVFDGAYYEVFIEAYTSLARKLDPKPVSVADKDGRVAPPKPASLGNESRRLHDAQAERKKVIEPEREGEPGQISHILSLSPEIPKLQIVRYFWLESGWQDILTDWFIEWGTHHSRKVRENITLTVGYLAREDFKNVRYCILYNWAEQDNADYRNTITRTLQAALNDTEDVNLTHTANAMLKEWAVSDKKVLRWAAVRSYVYAGQYYPQDAMYYWQYVAEREDDLSSIKIETEDNILLISIPNPLMVSLMQSIANFFLNITLLEEQKAQNLLSQALKSLFTWGVSGRKKLLALRLFEAIAYQPQPIVDDDDKTFTFSAVPALLFYLWLDVRVGTNFCRQSLSKLFYTILNNEDAKEDGYDLVRMWIDQADEDIEYVGTVVTLVMDVVRQGQPQVIPPTSNPAKTRAEAEAQREVLRLQQDQQRDFRFFCRELHRYLREWAFNREKPSPTAAHILQTLGW